MSEADLRKAYLLLAGDTVKSAKGLLEKRYLKSKEEAEARKAIARLLRNGEPVDSLLRQLLAALFDRTPTGDKAIDDFFAIDPIERKLILQRPAGRGIQAKRMFAIAERVRADRINHPDKNVTDIIEAIALDTGRSEKSIANAYQRYKRRLQGEAKILSRYNHPIK